MLWFVEGQKVGSTTHKHKQNKEKMCKLPDVETDKAGRQRQEQLNRKVSGSEGDDTSSRAFATVPRMQTKQAAAYDHLWGLL